MQGKRIRLKLESNLDVVEAMEMVARQAAMEKKIAEDEVDRLGIAVRECIVNAVSHGNGYRRDKAVFFTVSNEANRLKIAVEDQGAGFDPDGVPDPTQADNLLQTSGRGLLLMRCFVDELTIGHTTEGGTEVVMVKNLPAGERQEKEEEVSLLSNVREVGGVTIIDLSGRITLGEGSEVLRDSIRDVLSNGQKNIVLNLGEVSYIDSSGLGTLVSGYTTGANQGAKIKLVNVQKKVNDLLQITKLYTIFESFDDESSAVGSYVS